ncbi:hypothetical protein SOVF_021250 isoform A [Spinacia oleracea]|nr:hypothetical protein SOVF_021250 isoform A [Spinacia oleracea]
MASRSSGDNSGVGSYGSSNLPHGKPIPKFLTPDTYRADEGDDIEEHTKFVLEMINKYNKDMRPFNVANPYEKEAAKCACLVKSLPITGRWLPFRKNYYWTQVYPFAPNMGYKDHDEVEFRGVRIEDFRSLQSVGELLKEILAECEEEEEREARTMRARTDKAKKDRAAYRRQFGRGSSSRAMLGGVGNERSESPISLSSNSTMSSVEDRVHLDPNYEPEPTPESSFDSGYANDPYRLD